MSEKQSPQMAFPYVSSDGRLFSEGMTLRDYFAAEAMPLAYEAVKKNLKEASYWDGLSVTEMAVVADTSYDMADAMLKARK